MKAVIFDFDGVIHDTLHDLHKIHCETLENLTLGDMKKKVFSGNSRKYFEKFTDEKKDSFEKAWSKHCETLTIDKSVKEEIEKLSRKYLIFIVSSNNEENIRNYFEKNCISGLITAIYGAETNYSKTEKFRLLLSQHRLNLKDCVFITDTLGDVTEANKVGIRTIAVDFGYHDREYLQKGKPFKIVSSFREIREIIQKQLQS